MKVFVFDLLAYGENLDHLKVGTELPYPLSKRHFKADVAVRTYAEHLDAWEEMDRLGYDGVGFNEHHCSPYGLMNSPNLMASAAAQRTKQLKLLIYGNLLPLHEPLRLAEELAMLDCLSNGRLISGFARGIPREYQVHNVPLAELARPLRGGVRHRHPRLDRGRLLLRGQVLVLQGRGDLAAARCSSRIRRSGSRSSAARNRSSSPARHDIPITPGLGGGGLRDDIIAYYAKCLAGCRPSHHAQPPVARHQRLRGRFQGAGGEGDGALSPLLQSHAVQPRQLHRDRAAAPGRATPARARPTTCGRRTSAPPRCCARTSATSPWPTSSGRPSSCRGARRTR